MTVLLSAKSLEPTPSAVPTATADQQHNENDDKKSCGVHVALHLGDKRGPRCPGITKDQKAPVPARQQSAPSAERQRRMDRKSSELTLPRYVYDKCPAKNFDCTRQARKCKGWEDAGGLCGP
jgi:hypothetical protein